MPAAGQQGLLLSIIELGGYPNYDAIYKAAGYTVQMVTSVRKALGQIKKSPPDVIVAEFNFQSDFRDRTSSLETLLASIQKYPDTRVIVFYEKEYEHQLQRLLASYTLHKTLAFPIDEAELTAALTN